MDYEAWIKELSEREGAPVEQSDIDRLYATNEDDRPRLMDALESQYDLRGRTQTTGSGPDSTERTAMGYGSGRNETADDKPSTGGGSSVAKAWLSDGAGTVQGGSGLFPNWYQDLLNKQQGRADSLYGMLSDRVNQGVSVDRNNPVIRAQSDAYAASQERARRNYVSNEAEKGGPFANIAGTSRMAAERAGQNTAGFEAELRGRDWEAQRAELLQYLAMMQGMLGRDQEAALRMQLAEIDAQLSREGMSLQRDLGYRGQDFGMEQFMRELALREWDTGNKWDYAWSRT